MNAVLSWIRRNITLSEQAEAAEKKKEERLKETDKITTMLRETKRKLNASRQEVADRYLELKHEERARAS